MQSKPGSGNNQLEPDAHAIPPSALYSEPWWRNAGYNSMPLGMRVNPVNSSSLDASESKDGDSLSNDELNEDNDNIAKESNTTASSRPDENCGPEHQSVPHFASGIPVTGDQCLTQPPQFELVGHSMACSSNPYQDPYYGATMAAAYGHQPLGYPPFVGMPRMPLPLEVAQEPVYVNAKQYQGILRRRQARAKAELERKLIKNRKPYLHESRHQHAMRRTRGNGGRFARKTDSDASNKKADLEKRTASGSSSGSEPIHSDSADTWNSSMSQQEAAGDCLGKQRGNMSSGQRRPLAIK
ncbi:hypothetical protein ACFE04_007958 [Oxalis oulophora]